MRRRPRGGERAALPGRAGRGQAALRRAMRAVRERRGSVMLLFGLSVMALFICAGLAVDATRGWVLRARLQTAVDAAVLQAVAANEDPTNQTKAISDASNLFWANFGRTRSVSGSSTAGCPGSTINTGFMGATMCGSGLQVTFPDSSHAQVQATASLPTTLMAVTGSNSVLTSTTALAQRAGGVELALVLDISLSMNFTTNDGSSKITALKVAANNMLNALYGSSSTVPNLWISLVPFAGVVNAGNSHTGWLDSTFTSGTFAGRVENDNTGTGWRGCVEARQSGGDLTEDGPGTARFAPYYWPTTLNQYPKSGGGFYAGDNDWTTATITDTRNADQSGTGGSIIRGPNLGCPHNAVVPPTSNKATVASAINALTGAGPVGTVVVQGLQWGWFTLSPSWQGSSGWNLTNAAGTPLPLSYNAPNNQKVVVLMTDGTSDVSGAHTFWGNDANCGSYMAPSCLPVPSNGATNAPKSAAWAGGDADTWYSPYGRASAGRISTVRPVYGGGALSDSNRAVRDFSAALDQKTSDMCTAMKAKGIIIYTIFFHGSQDDTYDAYLGAQTGTAGAKTILQNCATDADHFYDANNSASISGAFVSIANQISALRLQK